jgi:ribosome-binding factor A
MVTIKTGDVHNGGTHAKVYITACGTKGDSHKKQLHENQDDFEQDKEAEFLVRPSSWVVNATQC